MEEINKNDEQNKPTGNTPGRQVPKPATRSTGSTTASTTNSDATKTPPRPAVGSKETSADTVPVRPTEEKPADTTTQVPEKAPGTSTPVEEKKSKKLAKAFKRLKIQKKEITSLEKNRDRLMKDLISAIENKKKGNKIRNLARDFNRIEKRVKTRTASYLRAKKKLAKKMK
jgi:hypothetical protein